MLRNSGLYCACAAAVLLWGCDLFSTREFRPKPTEIRTLSGLAAKGDSISFRVTESIWQAEAKSAAAVLSRRRLVFTLQGDSLIGADTLKALSLRVMEDSSGLLIEQDTRLVRFTDEGALLEGTPAGGGARFFPLKTAAGSGNSDASAAGKTASGTAAAAAGADSAFPALPAFLIEGWSERRAMGVLEVRRMQTSVDTLEYQGRIEEAWGVSENVLDGIMVLATGKFWYGASGLLRAEQTWPEFGWRDANGGRPAASANDGAPRTELRRILERL